MANTAWTYDSAGTTAAYPLELANWSVQVSLAGTGAVTADISIQVSNDNVGWVEIATMALTDTDFATNIVTVQSAYKLVRIEVEAITGTDAVASISIEQRRS